MSLASLDQLDRSHRRHDDVMSQLLEAARRLAAGRPHDTDAEVVRDAVAYFERAVTRHFLDEEGSVFPRLSTRRPELAEALASLSAEHPAQIALQNAVAECVKQLDDDSRLGAGKALLELAEKLADLHRQHVEREDEIFRDAHAALTEEDDADIVAEMETRRDRDSEDSGRIRTGGGRGMGGGGGGGGGGRNRSGSDQRQVVATKPAAKKQPGAKAGKPAAKSASAKNASAKSAKTAKPTKRAAKTARATSTSTSTSTRTSKSSKAKPKKSAKPAKKSAKKKR